MSNSSHNATELHRNEDLRVRRNAPVCALASALTLNLVLQPQASFRQKCPLSIQALILDIELPETQCLYRFPVFPNQKFCLC